MTRREAPAAATRHRLVDATVAIVAADGVRALTATAIARRAHLELHAVSRYFGSRDQLLVSAAASVVKGRVLPVADPGTGRNGRTTRCCG